MHTEYISNHDNGKKQLAVSFSCVKRKMPTDDDDKMEDHDDLMAKQMIFG